MNNTNEKVNKIYQKMLKKISGEERIKMGFSMFGFAKKLILVNLKEKKVSKKELQKRMFLRIYGSDFGKRKRERILEAL